VARQRILGLPPGPTSAKAADTVHRLKISLKWIVPMIWRRIELPDCSLYDLHAIIQTCMPWESYHMWSFEITRDERYGDQDDEEMEYLSADRIRLDKLAARKVKKFVYLYDFGDGWEHTITFEKPVKRDPKAKYPRCVAGARACPPEDCGGVPGYGRLLEILADPDHAEYEERMEWVGGEFDPEAFDPDAITKELQRLKLR